jgi:hypothetical protein
MSNKKLAAGVIAAILAGVFLSELMSSKKVKKTGRTLYKKGEEISENLKGRFSDFVDHLQVRAKGILK